MPISQKVNLSKTIALFGSHPENNIP